MKKLQKYLSLALAVIMLLSVAAVFAGCGTGEEGPTQTQATQAGSEGDTVEEDHRFDGVDYKGREFRIYTSTNAASAGMGNSNFLIEGTGETDGGLVNDAVLERNIQVEELLGVELVFTQVDLTYRYLDGYIVLL